MRHYVLGFFIAFLLAPMASATPVYLKIESRFPSGHYKRQLLEGRMKKLQTQRWVRVETVDKAYGWVPESNLVTALDLVDEASLKESAPFRSEPALNVMGREILGKGSRIRIIGREGSWIQASFILGGIARKTWVASEVLVPIPRSPSSRLFVPSRTRIYVLPGEHARLLKTATVSEVLEVLSERSGWFEVRLALGSGFVRRADVLTASDLGESRARPARDHIALRTAPLPYANLARHLPSSASLRIVASQSLRWGQSRISELGEVWWPIHGDGDEDRDFLARERLTTPQLFGRKIFDMASSPAIASLKFASAQGVYRTTDGKEWTKLPFFTDKNYPIAIAGSGAIFVGPYVSDDHGETFEQWIRWDSLIATLKRFPNLSAQKMQIQDIRPEDPAGRRVVLKLSVGQEWLVKLVTDDQGVSWRAL